jgi:hypothetical protein
MTIRISRRKFLSSTAALGAGIIAMFVPLGLVAGLTGGVFGRSSSLESLFRITIVSGGLLASPKSGGDRRASQQPEQASPDPPKWREGGDDEHGGTISRPRT